MHMQDGIGRSGYRLLASVFLGIGVLGLVTTLYAFEQASAPRGLFDWLGFALTFVALIALYCVSFVILWKPGQASTAPAPPPAGAPSLPAAMPGRAMDFEFHDPHETGPEVAIPIAAAQAAREPLVVQPNRNLTRDTKGWPRRQPPSGLTMGERRELQAEAVQMLTTGKGAQATEEIEFQATPPRPRKGAAPTAPAAPAPRQPLFNAAPKRDMAVRVEAHIPVAIARVAGPDDDPSWNPVGTTIGKCGGCGTRLYAPKERPIHLRCPKCEKLTLLK